MQVYESNICLEFLEDYAASPSLLPPHPAVRARARLIVDTFTHRFVPAFYKLLLRWAYGGAAMQRGDVSVHHSQQPGIVSC